ncbi:MAG: alpha/beta hydrolase fold domain-containing protein [Planctomycetota bacterium]
MNSNWWLAIVVLALASPLSKQSSADEGDRVPEGKVVVRYNIPYAEGAGFSRMADIYQPISEGRFPAIVMIHGGAWFAGDKSYDALHARRFAAQGYVVMVINYRLAPTHKHPAQIDDCFESIRWLVSNAETFQVDGDRIGVWGYSAGGHLAALVATNPRSGIPRVKACVAGGAPCDLRLIPDDSGLLQGFLGGTRAEVPEIYEAASPIHHVSEDDPPMLLFHGEADRLVPIAFSLGMRQRLEDKSVACEFLPLEKKSHIMAFVDQKAIQQSIEFFDRHLKP